MPAERGSPPVSRLGAGPLARSSGRPARCVAAGLSIHPCPDRPSSVSRAVDRGERSRISNARSSRQSSGKSGSLWTPLLDANCRRNVASDGGT
jgi:hypothetical protein